MADPPARADTRIRSQQPVSDSLAPDCAITLPSIVAEPEHRGPVMAATTYDPRYPVGRFERPPVALGAKERAAAIDVLAQAPQEMRATVRGLSDTQLDTPYRDGGWTVRQVIHHVPDSHLNAYIRCKLALTEDTPTIKPYDEAKWAELEDGRSPLVEESLTLLDALHARWV